MQMLFAAWDAVRRKTVVKSCWKSKILIESQKAAIAEEDDFFKELEDLRSIQLGLFSETIDTTCFIDVDAEVLAVQPPPSDIEMVAEMWKTEDVSNDNDDAIKTEDEPTYCPDRNEPLLIIQTMRKLSLFSKDGAIVQSYANHAARIIDQHFAEKSRQTTIRDYFQNL